MAIPRRIMIIISLLIFSLVFFIQGSSQTNSIIQVVSEGETQWRGDCFNQSSCTVTIEDLLENASNFFRSNTSIQFLSDQYEVKPTRHNILIRNAINLDIGGTVLNNGDQVRILCVEQFSLTFVNVTNITVSNIHFVRCSGEVPLSSSEAIREYINNFNNIESSTIAVTTSRNVQFQNIAIENTTGFGLVTINIFTKLTLDRVTLSNNTVNCLIANLPPRLSHRYHQDSLMYEIRNSIFKSGNIGNSRRLLSSGLNVLLMDIEDQQIFVVITNVISENNLCRFGNIMIEINMCRLGPVFFYIDKLISRYSHSPMYKYMKTLGISVVRIIKSRLSYCPTESYISEYNFLFKHTTLENSGFHVIVTDEHRYKGRITILMNKINIYNSSRQYYSMSMVDVTITFTDIHMENSSYIKATDSTVRIDGQSNLIKNNGVLCLVNTSLYLNGNTCICKNSNLKSYVNYGSSIIILLSSIVFFEGNTLILENIAHKGTTISAKYESVLKITGTVLFKENKGYNGGAIALFQGSYIMIGQFQHKENTSLAFINNTAYSYGGAVYIEDYSVLKRNSIAIKSEIPCWLKINNPNIIQVDLVFKDNEAGVAGNIIFGGWLDNCKNGFGSVNTEVYQTHNDSISISSTPLRVCFCKHSIPDCETTDIARYVTPGNSFTIEAIAVGQLFGIIPTLVKAEVLTDQFNIREIEKYQTVGKVCTKLTYTVSFKDIFSYDLLLLTVERSNDIYNTIITNKDYAILFKDFQILLISTPCPKGYVFNTLTKICDCNQVIIENGLDCQLQTGTVSRHRQWITATSNHTAIINYSQEVGVIVHKHCPFDYCNQTLLILDLEYPDTQCHYNRTGTLCGMCGKNLSAIFGSSNCKQCTNIWVLLIVPVVLIAGVCLVLFLTKLNLTISSGTINGLVFYANIIRANQTIFFPQEESNKFLSWFVAWLNLDIGFEVCFYNGMDAFVKTWLQFVFPLYIWLLVIIIIIASHYSVRAAKLTGNNAIQVLATLFLLSYAKLLRLTITSFSFTTLTYPDEYTERVWLYDGNVNYLQGKHIALFLAAIAVLLFLSIPYTIILLSIQWLQRYTQYILIKWVTKFLPLFEAHTGPYKDKYRYWPGFLLLVRVILFLVFSMNTGGDPTINLLAITITMFCLLTYNAYLGGVYKQWSLDTLECSYFINLGILSSTTIYYIGSGESGRLIVVFASTGIAFVTFAFIILYHIYLKFSLTVQGEKLVRWFVSKIKRNSHTQDDEDNNIVIESHSAVVTLPSQSVVDLHEPLLDINEDDTSL